MAGRRRILISVVAAAAAIGIVGPTADADPPDADDPTVGEPLVVDRLPTPDTREYRLGRGYWPDLDVTYGFDNFGPDMTQAEHLDVLDDVADQWAAVSGLRFRRVADCGRPVGHASCLTPDIRLLFASGTHSNFALDPSFTVEAAHAFFPMQSPAVAVGIAGDVHFDIDMAFTTTDDPAVGSGTAFPLLPVALHEVGHSLGLDHSTSTLCTGPPTSSRPIMCAGVYPEQVTLAPDDIAGIRSLYGSNRCEGFPVRVDLRLGQQPTNRSEVISGTPGPDVINALDGNDLVCGGGGADALRGGSGGDRINGGPGIDTCLGGPGADQRLGCEFGG
jgi:hypothetical protein